MSYHATANRSRVIPIMSYIEYCKNRSHQQFDYGFVIRNGVGCYVKDGAEFSREEIEALFPTPDQLFFSENCETSKQWMYK